MEEKRLTRVRINGLGPYSGYWSPANKEELVARLAEYENTGLTPAEIEVIKNNQCNDCVERRR